MRVLNFFMKIFWFILNFAASFFYHKEPVQQTSRMRSRKLPLHTCAASILSSSRRAYTKAQGYNDPSGLFLRKSARFVDALDPYALEIRNWCLSILTLVDDRILAIECTIEKNFPAAAFVFDRFDNLVRGTETFPDKAERIVNKLHLLLHKVPFLSQASSYLTSRLESWLSKSGWEIAAQEKDIQVDSRSAYIGEGIVSDKHCQAYDEEAGKEPCLTVEPPILESKTSDNCVNISPKGTFKEVLLDKGNTEDQAHQVASQEGDDLEQKTLPEDAKSKERGQKQKESKKAVGDTTEEEPNKDDPILDLFEAGWHMNKPMKRGKGSPMARVLRTLS